jgi:hypothetical protein
MGNCELQFTVTWIDVFLGDQLCEHGLVSAVSTGIHMTVLLIHQVSSQERGVLYKWTNDKVNLKEIGCGLDSTG